MRDAKPTLLEEILEANEEYLAKRPAPRPRSLGETRLLVLTCMEPQLTALLPQAMGVAPEEMFQVRTAGNRVLGPDGDPIRSLVAALALGVATEVFLVGHTDCAMRRATAMSFLDGMKAVGLDRARLGGKDVREWFGAIASERTNAMEGATIIRNSPCFPSGTPIHALLVDTATGKLDVVESGYKALRSNMDERQEFQVGRSSPSFGPTASILTDMDEHSILDTVPLDILDPEPPLILEPEPPPILEPKPLGKQRKPPPLPLEEPPPPPPPRKPKPRPAKQAGKEKKPESPFERAEDVLERLLKRRGK